MQKRRGVAGGTLKIGDLARRSGVSIRALRHYDEIGLLRPSARSGNGYRLYDSGDIERLGQIKSLQQLGFSLGDIDACLKRKELSPETILSLHLQRVSEQIERAESLKSRLEMALSQLEARQSTSVDELLKIIEAITMFEKYYTPEQLEALAQRRQDIGEERIREVEAEWPHLMDEVRAAIERGDDPQGETGQHLARRWSALVNEFTGGDAGIHQSLGNMYESESQVEGMDISAMKPLMEFIGRANEAKTPKADGA